MKPFCHNLGQYRNKKCSQGGQDGILGRIFSIIGTTNKYFVEFGIKFTTDNSMNLRRNGWSGLWMDGNPELRHAKLRDKKKIPPNKPTPLKYFVQECKKEWISMENINDLFKKYNVPYEPDYVSIDVDGNDYWIWKILDYFPRVVTCEFNPFYGPDISKTIVYDSEFVWTRKTSYFGATLMALKKLAFNKGYSLVYAEGSLDGFFIRNDLLHSDDQKIEIEKLMTKFPYGDRKRTKRFIQSAKDRTPYDWVEV